MDYRSLAVALSFLMLFSSVSLADAAGRGKKKGTGAVAVAEAGSGAESARGTECPRPPSAASSADSPRDAASVESAPVSGSQPESATTGGDPGAPTGSDPASPSGSGPTAPTGGDQDRAGLDRPCIASPLRVLASNPRYFTDGSGRAVYLTGSHVHHSLQDIDSVYPPAPFDFAAYLDRISRLGHNFMRMWSWESAQQRNLENGNFAIIEPTIWMRTGPGVALDGRPKFDLSRLNQAHFDRLRSRVIAARDRGIYVSVMLFEGWMLQFMEHQGHPFQLENNINDMNGDPDGDRRPVETHRVSLDSPIGQIQKAYVRKVINTLNDLDNVLYEIANEDGGGTVQWQYDLLKYIKSYEATKPKQHPVGMTYRYDGGTNEELVASPADWISPGGIFTELPEADGKKVIVSDTDHMTCMVCVDDRDWVWRSFTRGSNPIFMEYPADRILVAAAGDAFEPARQRMGQTLMYANRMNLAAMAPRGDLSSTGYALAAPGQEYLIYHPTGGGSFTVQLVAGSYAFEWFNPSTGSIAQTGSFTTSNETRSFAPPFGGDAVLYLRSSAAPRSP